MKNLYTLDLNRICDESIVKRFGGVGDESHGVFSFPSKIDGADLFCIAACMPRWHFVSVQRKNRFPNWIEMEQIRAEFFEPNELTLQYHLPFNKAKKGYILYLWHPVFECELPPIAIDAHDH